MRLPRRLLLALLGTLAVASSVSAQSWVLKPYWFMREGGFLRNGEYIQGQNHAFYLAMTAEGRLSLHKGSGPSENYGFIWSPNKHQPAGPHFAIVQADGNFVIYKGTGPSDNRGFVWHTGTGSGQPTATSNALLVLGDDGNLLLYNTATAVGSGVWHSNTATRIDWIPDAMRMVFGSTGRALWVNSPPHSPSEAPGASMAGAVAPRWALMKDGSIRMAYNTAYCLSANSNAVPNQLGVHRCDWSDLLDVYGWRYDAATGKLDHRKFAGCAGLDLGRNYISITNPCPIGDKNATPDVVDAHRIQWIR